MEALGVKYSFHYRASFTALHYFLIVTAFVPHFFRSDLCPKMTFMKKKGTLKQNWVNHLSCFYAWKRNSVYYPAQTSWVVRSYPPLQDLCSNTVLFWELPFDPRDSVYLQKCLWELCAAEVTACMQYLVYTSFFIRPLQGTERGLSKLWGVNTWSCKDFTKSGGSSEKARSLWKTLVSSNTKQKLPVQQQMLWEVPAAAQEC